MGSLVIGYGSLTIGHWQLAAMGSLVIGYGSLTIGHWQLAAMGSLVIGFGSLTIVYWLLTIGYRLRFHGPPAAGPWLLYYGIGLYIADYWRGETKPQPSPWGNRLRRVDDGSKGDQPGA